MRKRTQAESTAEEEARLFKKEVRRPSAALLVGTTCVLLVVACGPVDEVYMKVEGRDVQFKICEPIEATAVTVQRIPVGSLDATLWEDAWRAGGASALDASSTLTFGMAPEGMGTTLGPNSLLDENWDVKLVVDGFAEDGREINIAGEWQTSRFEQGVWYADDGGQPDDEPCSESPPD